MKRLRFLISMLLCIAMLFSAAACNTDTSDVYKLNKTSITLEVGQTEKLSVSDDAGNAVSAVFSSDDEAVATVAEDGTVTAVKAGSATVTAKVNDSVSLTCSVTVTGGEEGPVEYDYALNYSSLTMRVSESKQLFVNVSPEKQITPEWSVEDDTIVSISANGTVTALKEGKTKVSAAVDGKTLTCDVTVQAKYTFILDCTQLTTKEGSTRQLNIVTVPDLEDDDSLPAFVWATTDEDVATVKDGLVTAVGKGDATITATYGTVQLACEVTVEEQIYSYQLNETSLVMEEGDSETLKVTSFPAQSSISVTWTTSNEDVATVEDGEVTAVGAGTAVITASVDGTKLTCSVTVNYPAGEEGVTAQATVTNIEGKSINLSDADATGALDTLYWEKYQGYTDESIPNDIITKADTKDIITPNKDLTVNNSTSSGFEDFGDYKAKISWSDGTPTLSGTNNTQGVCVRAELRFTIDVDPTVKEIRLYTGAWRGVNKTTLLLGTTELASSEEFSAEDTSVGRMITYKLNVEAERTLTLVIEPTDTFDNGNCSLVAIAVLGTEISYSLSNNILNLPEEETAQLSVNCSVPENQFTVVYESSAPTIASVNSDGLVTALSEGTATITATINDTDKLTCTVNVTKVSVSYEYTLSETELTLDLNTSHKLSVSVSPDKDITVSWSTNNDSVATVTQDGTVTAIGSGSAIITAAVDDGQELNCTVTVPELAVSASAAIADAEGLNVNLTDIDETLDTLYWEHYQGNGADAMLNANDRIVPDRDICADGAWTFSDYKANISWSNGTKTPAYSDNKNGICLDSETSFQITVDPSVRQIRVYTGSWNATGNVRLMLDDMVLSSAESFTAGGTSISRVITFTIEADSEQTLTLVITPSGMPEGNRTGNTSLVAIALLGEAVDTATTSLSMSKSEMTGYNENHVNLTEKGTRDWFYLNFDNVSDQMNGGDGSILTDTLNVQSNSAFWDYKAAFSWTNGTTYETSPVDNDCNDQGTNNGLCGAYCKIDVKVDSETKHIYLWVGGYDNAEYYVEAVDQNGNVIFNELVGISGAKETVAYELDLAVTASAAETLSFIVYRTAGANCSLAAVAVA